MKIRDHIIALLDAQNTKGKRRYGHTLDDASDTDFDWRLMALEELTDLVQYQQKEIIRLERENKVLDREIDFVATGLQSMIKQLEEQQNDK